MPSSLKLSSKPDSHGDEALNTQISTEKVRFKSQLTAQYMASAPHNIQLNPNRYRCYHCISYLAKKLAPYEYWIENFQKKIALQFLRPSVFDFHNEDLKPNFQNCDKKNYIMRQINFFGITFLLTSQKNFIVQNRKFGSPFALILFYNLKPAYTNGPLSIFDTLKQQISENSLSMFFFHWPCT